MLDNRNYFVYDYETGGFTPHTNPVIEIAIVVVNSTTLQKVERYENYIKPYDNLFVTSGALEANGIDMNEVMSKGISVEQFYKDFIALCKKYKEGRFGKPVLVGHNSASFDTPFFEYIVDKFEPRTLFRDKEKKVPLLPYQYAYNSKLYSYVERYQEDTMFYSRQKWGHIEVENHKLGTTAERCGVKLSDAHRAMNDTDATADIFIKKLKDLREISQNNNGKIEVTNSYIRKFQF